MAVTFSGLLAVIAMDLIQCEIVAKRLILGVTVLANRWVQVSLIFGVVANQAFSLQVSLVAAVVHYISE